MDKLLLIYEYICRYTPGLPPFFTITLYVAKEIMQFHITKTCFYYRTIVFCTQLIVLGVQCRYNYPLGTCFSNGFLSEISFLFHFCFISVISRQSYGYLGIINFFPELMRLAQGHNMASQVRIEPPSSHLLLLYITKPIRNF